MSGEPLSDSPLKRGVKRPHSQTADDGGRSDEGEKKATQTFLEWCKDFQLNSKVTLSTEKCASGLGMLAIERIQSGEKLFAVPNSCVLCPENCRIYATLCVEGLVEQVSDASSEDEEDDDDDDADEVCCSADSDKEQAMGKQASPKKTPLVSSDSIDLEMKSVTPSGKAGHKDSEDPDDSESDFDGDYGVDDMSDVEVVEDDEDDRSRARWATLLLCLVAEYTAKESFWHPYLHCMADSRDIDLPHTWPADMRSKLLHGLGMLELIEADVEAVEWQHKHIALPFIEKHPKLFGPGAASLDLYKKLSSFVMANSFTDTRSSIVQTVMVPMADVLNHHYNHNAELEVIDGQFFMCAIRDIEKGEEVYNTYGRSGLYDTDLLRLYGFTIGPPLANKPTAAYIPLQLCQQACVALKQPKKKSLEERWEYLLDLGVYEETDVANLGTVVCETGKCTLDEALATTISVLAADTRSNWLGQDVDPVTIPATDQERKLLSWVCQEQLKQFNWSAEACGDIVLGPKLADIKCRRVRSALRVCFEQVSVLRQLLKRCQPAT